MAVVMFADLVQVLLLAGVACAAERSQHPLRYNVSEELPVDTLVGDVGADYAALTSTPVDAGNRYSLREPSSYFRMDDGGVMRTAGSLDRESVCPSRPPVCELDVDVVLRGRRLVRVIKVIVSVVDVSAA